MNTENRTTFKSFLLEGTAYELGGSKLAYKQLSLDEVLQHLQTDFLACAWMVSKSTPFYRGERDYVTDTYAWVDSSKSKRISEHTTNYYTLIFDNHPDRKIFPKRSSSIICTTSEVTASEYDRYPLRIIPGNTAKIGFVNASDMWETKISLFGITGDIAMFNSIWEEFPSLSEFKWQSWKNFDKKLKAGDKAAVERFNGVFSKAKPSDHLNFLESVLAAYDPIRTGHTAYTARDISPAQFGKESEAWISGPCLVINETAWTELLETYSQL